MFSAKKTMMKNKEANHVNKKKHVGPLDILIVSPVQGEPYFIFIKKEQVSSDAWMEDLKTFIKQYAHQGVRWTFSFNGKDRWHQVRRLPPPPSLPTP